MSSQMIRSDLHIERLGPLPIINHFIARMGLDDALARHVPSDQRCTVPHARALGVLLRSIIVEREPIYRQQETVQGFAAGMFGIAAEEMEHLGDDRLGRALDRLFDADRAALITDAVLAVGQVFGLKFEEINNDSTTVSFCGAYRSAWGRKIRGRTAPAINYGISKDHRPDLKQLLFILTTTADGGIPVAFRCSDGNTSDSRTHIDTWNTLRAVAGRVDFLYVADSKLCSRENMDHIDRAGGRFVTVLPRSRSEDEEFRTWIQTHTPDWTCVWDRRHPAMSMDRATVGSSVGRPCLRRKAGPSSGCGARCSPCARNPGGRGTWPPQARSSPAYVSGSPGQGPDCGAPPISTFTSRPFSRSTTSFATSRLSAPRARTTSSSKHGGADQVPRRPIAKSQSDASTSNGRLTRRPSPTITKATACIRPRR